MADSNVITSKEWFSDNIQVDNVLDQMYNDNGYGSIFYSLSGTVKDLAHVLINLR